MGLGLHGGGVAVVKWLVKHDAQVTLTDLKTKKELKASLDRLKGLKVNYVLGRHRASDFSDADLIVQNPGVPRESKYLKIAKNKGVLIENDASLFFKHCPASIIGVTGTRGKSTTSSLIYQLLRRSAKKVWLAGLPQKPMLEILDEVRADDLVVLELSSWQLEIIGQFGLAPQIGVITNIYPDHLNRYSSMSEYIAAKRNMVLWQTGHNFSILNLDNPETKKLGKLVTAQRLWFSKKQFKEENGVFVLGGKIYFRINGRQKSLIKISEIALKGDHNLENVLAALAVAGLYRVALTDIKLTLKEFSGLPGRFETIRIKDGIRYVNDTTATTPDGTMAALKALTIGKKNIILIAGGASKNIPQSKYQDLAKLIKKKCRAVVLFSGDGGQPIKRELEKLSFKPLVYDVNTMSEALGLANGFARAGSAVVLSPASASFGMFINEFDRGSQFVELVKKL